MSWSFLSLKMSLEKYFSNTASCLIKKKIETWTSSYIYDKGSEKCLVYLLSGMGTLGVMYKVNLSRKCSGFKFKVVGFKLWNGSVWSSPTPFPGTTLVYKTSLHSIKWFSTIYFLLIAKNYLLAFGAPCFAFQKDDFNQVCIMKWEVVWETQIMPGWLYSGGVKLQI
jgi:hypothetical protein